ncbi:unnamed protein product [Discula destructiva]
MPPASASDTDVSKITLLKDALYDAIVDSAAGDQNALFAQEDLLALGITTDLHQLLMLIQRLVNEKLLILYSGKGGTTLWKWRTTVDAAKYRGLNREQSIVYEMVDEAGADGIWSRTLKARSGFHDSVLKTHLKFLESKNYIGEMKSVEHPNKKMYIKAGLRPSDRAAGGSWYTDGELDEAFISELLKFVFDYVTQQSTYRHIATSTRKKEPKKGIVRGDAATANAAKGKKRAANDMSTEDPAPALKPAVAAKKSSSSTREPKTVALLPLPAGYNGYPTTRQIAQFIAGTGITETTLTIPDVQQLVDVLVFDGLLEPISSYKPPRYRTVRPLATDPTPLTAVMRDSATGMDEDVMDLSVGDMGAHPRSNGLTEAPCGMCPVFELCEEGGPVSPGNCVYWERWLHD